MKKKVCNSGIGGQAVLEGVMMKNKEAYAIAVRKADGDMIISASTVRQAIHDGDQEILKRSLPVTTLNWLNSEEAIPVIAKIRNETDLIHY